MTTLRKAMPFTLLCAALLVCLPLAAQNNPDCSFTFTFTGNATMTARSNLSGNTPCVNWRVTFSTTATLTSVVTLQTSPDNSTWTAVPNTICSASVQPPCLFQGANPTASGAQGMIYASLYGNYVRVITTGSAGAGTGTVRGYGAKGATASTLPLGGGGGGSGTVTQVNTTGPITGGPITGSGTIALDTTKVAQKFFGTAAPGSVAGNLPGDLFTDTTAHNEYVCNAPAGTAAPACTSVTAAGWLLVNGGGGGSGTVTQVNTTGPITGGPITGTGTIALDTTKVAQKFFGTAAPGSVATNLPGDLFTDTTNHNEYICGAPSGTAAPACTSVTAGGWMLGPVGPVGPTGPTGPSGTSVPAASNLTPVTVSANTTGDQTLQEVTLTAGALNTVLAANLIHGSGRFTIAALQTPALTFKAKLCTVSGCGSGTVVTLATITSGASLASTTNQGWNLQLMAGTSASGATGNLWVHGAPGLTVDIGALPGSAATPYTDTNTAVSSNIDLTGVLYVDFTVATSSGNAGNSITQDIAEVLPQGAGGGGSSSGLLPWQPLASPPPLDATWTFVNIAGNGTHQDVRGGVLLNSVSGNAPKYLYGATPGAAGDPFTLTGHFSPMLDNSSQFPSYGILVGDTANRIVTWECITAGGLPGCSKMIIEHWDNAASGAVSQAGSTGQFATWDTWFRIKYDGSAATNTFTFQISPTGTDDATWVTIFSESASAYLASAPAKLGFDADSQNSAAPVIAILNYWRVTTP